MIFVDIGMSQNEQNNFWYKMFSFPQISSQFYHVTGNFENAMTCLLPQISQAKLGQFQLSGSVLESSGRTDFKTVPAFEF